MFSEENILYIVSETKVILLFVIPSGLHVKDRENYIHHNVFQEERWICSEVTLLLVHWGLGTVSKVQSPLIEYNL